MKYFLLTLLVLGCTKKDPSVGQKVAKTFDESKKINESKFDVKKEPICPSRNYTYQVRINKELTLFHCGAERFNDFIVGQNFRELSKVVFTGEPHQNFSVNYKGKTISLRDMETQIPYVISCQGRHCKVSSKACLVKVKKNAHPDVVDEAMRYGEENNYTTAFQTRLDKRLAEQALSGDEQAKRMLREYPKLFTLTEEQQFEYEKLLKEYEQKKSCQVEFL